MKASHCSQSRKRSNSTGWIRVGLLVTTLLCQCAAQSNPFSLSISSTCVPPNSLLQADYQVRGDDDDSSWYWMGIFPDRSIDPLNSRSATLQGEPELWVWACGDQECKQNQREGSVTFGIDQPGSWQGREWPLSSDEMYRVVLVNFVEEEVEETVVAVAFSDPFVVSSDCESDANENSNESTSDPLPLEDTSPPEEAENLIEENITEEDIEAAPPTSRPTMSPPPRPNNMAPVIQNARQEIARIIQARKELSAIYLRMIFHDCVGGGCDGCINIDNPDNGGLNSAIFSLEEVAQKYESQGLSRADVWVLASYVGVDMALPGADENNTANFIPFQHYGRQNCDSSTPFQGPNPPLCSPNLGTDQVLQYFEEHFNFTSRETAAIMGAHTIGIARRTILGFDGANGWVPNNVLFDHQYYEELVGVNTDPVEGAPQWRLNFVNNSNFTGKAGSLPDRFQWEGFPGGRKVMMLNSDIALVRQLDDSNKDSVTGEVFCKFVSRGPPENQPRCPVARSDLFNPMVEYANDNELFLNDFRDAMIKMTDTGYRVGQCDGEGICLLTLRN